MEHLGGGWTLDFSECPIDPPGGGGWTLDLSESPTDPLGGGGWTLDFEKERIQVHRGGCYKVTLVLFCSRVSSVRGGKVDPPAAARAGDRAHVRTVICEV